ncbi:MAG TPA: hypothetical protein VFP40_01355 [Terriglobales bacterium]|nr:hypothetical protein [Terriglobales bacterium]
MMRRPLLLITALLVFVGSSIAQSGNVQVKSRIDALREFAAAQSPDDENWKDLKPGVERYLMLSEEALKAGHLYFAIEELGKANEYANAYRFMKQGPATLTMSAFESQWKKSSVQLAALDREAKQRKWVGVPIAVRALAESAQGQGPTLVEASRAYATVTNAEAGYFYLGQANADEEFAKFVHGLGVKSKNTAFAPRSILPEIQKLQDKINAAFVPPRSIEKHKEFIRLNSTLKLAGELDAAQLYAGALYQYLQSVVQFQLLDAKDLDAGQQATLRDQIAVARKKVESSHSDDSLAQMFVERSETLIANKAGKDATQEEWTNASVVVSAALPAYYQVLASHEKMPSQQKDAVTVTLVRWPYT